MKFKFYILLFLFFNNILLSLKIGLDSSHSIKELYKSGGVFKINVFVSNDGNGNPIIKTKPYYSIGWPAGGVKWDSISSIPKKNAYKYYVLITNSVDMPDNLRYNQTSSIC